MNVALRRIAVGILVGVLLFQGSAHTQQSPTSPRPRPEIPEDAPPAPPETQDENGGTQRDGGRFSGELNRFNPGPTPGDAEKSPAIRHDSEVAQPGTDKPSELWVIRGEGRAAGGAGLISGAGQPAAGAGPQAQPLGPIFVQGQAITPVRTFEPILEREVEYPPLPEGGEVLMDLTGPKKVSEFLEDIRVATLWNILVSEAVKDREIQFWITKATPQQALEILKFHELYYEFDEKTGYFYVMSVEEWQRKQFGQAEERKFVLEHAEVTTAEPLLSAMLSGAGKMVAEPRTRTIYVWDTPDNLAAMERTIAEVDVPLDKAEFKVEFAEFADVEAAFAAMLSPAGSLLPDRRTNTLLVWDQANVLERMGDALEALDVPVESRTFYLAHARAVDMVEYLDALVSERGIVQIDPRYNAIIVSDLPGKLNQIGSTLETLDQAMETRTWTLDYADLDFVAEQLAAKIPAEMGDIVVQEEVHQITISGIPSRLDEIDALIKQWDVQRKQVQIEAFIVEVGSDVEREFNINWSYFGSNGESPIFFNGGDGFNPEGGNLNIGQLPYTVPLYGALELDENNQIVRPIVTNIDGENVIDRVAGNDLAVTLEYLDQRNKATVLSSPRVAVQDGEEATFENKTEVPFVSATTFFANNSINNFGNTNNTNRVEFIDVGTILRVLPRITTKDNILLDISAEDSTFIEVRVLANDQESTVPQKTVRRAETQLRIQSGDTVVLGGLRRDRAGKTETRTPLLGDLPGIGRLFRYPNKQSEKSSLLIFITPTIVDEFTDPQAAMLASAEESIAEQHRHNQKSLWGRIGDTVSRHKNEVTISVGQSGDIHAEGERAEVEELRTLFEEAPAKVTVVLRHHPRAPGATVTAITELALELDRKVDIDDDLVPLVPRYKEKKEKGSKKREPALEGATPEDR